MSSKIKEVIDVNYGLVIKFEVHTEMLVWAIRYQVETSGIPYSRISRSGTEKFLRKHLNAYGCEKASLYGPNYDPETIPDEEVPKIINVLERIFKLK